MNQSYYTRPTWRSAMYYAHWLASTTGVRYSVQKDLGWSTWTVRQIGTSVRS